MHAQEHQTIYTHIKACDVHVFSEQNLGYVLVRHDHACSEIYFYVRII